MQRDGGRAARTGVLPTLSVYLWRGFPRPLRRLAKRIHCLAFFDSFVLALRATPVNSERYYWGREFVIHMPGAIGNTYRSLFYNHYFRRKGAGLVISPGVCIEHPGGLEMGNGVTINRNVWFNAVGGLRIGDSCGFGPGVVIHTANHNYERTDIPWLEQGWTMKPVSIGEDVWVAAAVTVLPGTQIGRGAIIAAGAVLRGSVEPYAIMAGVPARRIGTRGAAAAPASAATDS